MWGRRLFLSDVVWDSKVEGTLRRFGPGSVTRSGALTCLGFKRVESVLNPLPTSSFTAHPTTSSQTLVFNFLHSRFVLSNTTFLLYKLRIYDIENGESGQFLFSHI